MELKTKKHNPDVVEFRVRNTKNPFWGWVPLDVFFPTILLISLVLLGVGSILFWILVGLLIILRISMRNQVVMEEALTVMRGLGIQLETVYRSGKAVQHFIEKKQIKDVIINEGIKSYKIVCYICILVEGQDKMTIAFHNLLPKLELLIPVFRTSRNILFDEADRETLVT